MDATQVLSQLTSTWSDLLDQYYDHVAAEHLKSISKEYNIPLEDLHSKTNGLKEQIMHTLTKCMDPPKAKTADKPVEIVEKEKVKQKKNKAESGTLESMGRKELQELCKQKGIPTKRKNSDMVDSIKEFDAKQQEKTADIMSKMKEEVEEKVEEKIIETEELDHPIFEENEEKYDREDFLEDQDQEQDSENEFDGLQEDSYLSEEDL